MRTKKKSSKQDREHQVLIGLVDTYIKSGKPVGSNTLKEAEFDNISAATIRNYFAHLEQEGFLEQQHASGGRIPTHKAYRAYCKTHYDSTELCAEYEVKIDALAHTETKEIPLLLQQACETLSDLTETAVFISAPRFDHDFIVDIKVVPIDTKRCVCILISDFGVIHTEILHIKEKLTMHAAHRIEAYFHWRLTGEKPLTKISVEEEGLARQFYNELMLRFIVGYANFTDMDLYKTGFSKLLHHSEFQETARLAPSLSLFENNHGMRLLLKEAASKNMLQTWIGTDLTPFTNETPDCAVIAHPYHINNQPAGSIGLLAPTRTPYKKIFGLMRSLAKSISEALTRNVYKYKISYRQPQPKMVEHFKKEYKLLGHIND